MGKVKEGAQRTCIACRATLDKNELIRYVVAPDGQLLVDYRHKLPGRGAYTCLNPACLKKAVDKNGFMRSFRGHCLKADYSSLEWQLTNAIMNRFESLLGMARKSGIISSGSNMVIDQLRKPQCEFGLIVIAQDISPEIGKKVESAAIRLQIPHMRVFNKDKIGQILGKEERSVVGILSGSLVDTMLNELSRYRLLVREN